MKFEGEAVFNQSLLFTGITMNSRDSKRLSGRCQPNTILY